MRLTRALGLDANPLRRGSDRVEIWIRVGLLVVFLVCAPLAALGVGRWAQAASEGSAQAHAASVHRVTATLLQSSPERIAEANRSGLTWTPAKWSGPGGATHTGEVPARAGAAAGAKVRIWVDDSGRLSEPPLTRGQLLSRVVTAIALTPVLVGLFVAFLMGLIHRLMERQRLLAWEAAWSAVEPQWSKRSR